MKDETPCPCGQPATYGACCRPRHDGSLPAETPEALMRSRYSAFAVADGAYLRATSTVPMGPDVETYARSVTWLGLTVVRAEGDTVEFVARSLDGDGVKALHEVSHFTRVDGRWLYAAGEPTVTLEKVERNAKCPCGSGKKFKQCHG